MLILLKKAYLKAACSFCFDMKYFYRRITRYMILTTAKETWLFFQIYSPTANALFIYKYCTHIAYIECAVRSKAFNNDTPPKGGGVGDVVCKYKYFFDERQLTNVNFSLA